MGNPDVQVVFSNWDPAKFVQDLRDAIAAKPDAIMMMGHAGDAAIMPLAKEASQKGIIMTYANVNVPKVRARYGGGYVGANLAQAGMSLGTKALQTLSLKRGDGALMSASGAGLGGPRISGRGHGLPESRTQSHQGGDA